MRGLSFAAVTTAVQSCDSSPLGPGVCSGGGGGGGGDLTHKRPVYFQANTLRSSSSAAEVTPGTRGPSLGYWPTVSAGLWEMQWSGAAAADRPSLLINAVLRSV